MHKIYSMAQSLVKPCRYRVKRFIHTIVVKWANSLAPVNCTLSLTVIPGQLQQETQTITLDVIGYRTVWDYLPQELIYLHVDLASGELLYPTGTSVPRSTVSVSPLYQTTASDDLQMIASANPTIGLKVTKVPNCNDLIFKFRITLPKGYIYIKTTVTLDLQIESTNEPEDHWQSTCDLLAANPSCNLEEEARCIEGPQTRIIEGTPITP